MQSESIYGASAEYLPHILEEFAARLHQNNEQAHAQTGHHIFEHLSYRLKSEESMREKCIRKSLPETPKSALQDIKDALGFRIICGFIGDIKENVERIRQLEGCKIIREKDYIKGVKPNGYRSYHLNIAIETDYPDCLGHQPGQYYAEIQLRTIAMDSWASLEHQLKYKKNIQNQALIVSELKRVADELASCDLSMQTIRELIRQENEK